MTCAACKDGVGFEVPITMAFQPIVDVSTETVFAYEALVRGQDGGGAGSVLAQVSPENRYAFDQLCRTTAIEWASNLDLTADGASLSINFLRSYRAMGFKTAIDDFGAGFAGLGLLSKFQPDIVKLDMALIRGIDIDRVKRVIVSNTLNMLRDLGVEPVCEGVETLGEYAVLRDLGVSLMQGYLLGRPMIEGLSSVSWPGRNGGVARSA